MMQESREQNPTTRSTTVLSLAIGIALYALPVAAQHEVLEPLTATAAIVVDHTSGRVLYERNPDLPLPPASTTKILTAYIALSSGKLDESFPVSREASITEPSKIGLRPGWWMNANDLVYATLLNSANDATVVLAEGLSGSVPAFANRMNDTAHRFGAVNSHFVNPNGLPAENHYSTARDLVRILHQALKLPDFRNVLSVQSTVVIPAIGSTRPITLRSHNRLLGEDEVQVIGKTGYTRAAKKCFVGAATVDGKEVLIALLGSTNLWGDARRLIDFGLNAENPDGFHAYLTDELKEARRPERITNDRSTDQARGSTSTPARKGRYQVRLGSFRTRIEASDLRKRIASHGYNVVVEPVKIGRSSLFRVTAHGFDSHAEAKQAAASIRRVYRVVPQVVSVGA